jgi:hypothetical protein
MDYENPLSYIQFFPFNKHEFRRNRCSRYMRSLILDAACSYGHEASVEMVQSLFEGYMKK